MTFSKHYVTREWIKNKALFVLSNLYFIIVSTFITIILLPFGYILVVLSKIFPSYITGKTFRKYSYCYGRIFCYVNSPVLPVSVRNKHEANKHKPCIIIANHQSALDLFLFANQTCTDFSYMVKSWPFRVLFFFAPIMHGSEYIDVETLSPEEVQARCLKLLKSGTSLVIFPEGKRTKTGEMGRFHTGAFRLACLANVPIVPLVFENTRAVFPAHSKLIHPQRLRISLLDAIFPEEFISSDLPHRDMMRFAQKQYQDYFYNLDQ